MKTILLEGSMSGLGAFILLMFALMLVPPLLLTIIGFRVKKTSPNMAKVLFIVAAIYLIIGLGICGSWIG